MIKGLSEFEKYKVIRPVIGEAEYDSNGFPIIHKAILNEAEWDNINAINLQNASAKNDNFNSILLMFNYDYKLSALWNNPLKKIALFQTFYAISTPDFSFYPNMNINDIRYNVYKSRWLGRTWQNYGCNVYPTIGWCLPNTYDLCLSAVEKGSIVVISTVGCHEHPDIFLNGFNEMKERINPPLIIVYGDMIEGMTGKFVNFKYKDAFKNDYYQYRIEGLSQIFEIKEVA